ncbi:MAG: HAMP domain-containing histidine kinase [Alteromonadaceae bacterium]|nr:HAMP domain-containing histidine kinase [Alteromonadaceae bacterium]
MFGINTKSQSPKNSIKALLLLRCIAIGAQIIVITIAHFGLGLMLDYSALSIIVGGEILINFATWLRTKHISRVSELECFAQLFADICFLGVLLYFSGGASNPFVSLFLVPIAIAAATLNRFYAWVLTIAATLLYSILMKYNIPLQHHEMNSAASFDLHLLGMWANFIISAILIAYFVVNMAYALHLREQEINLQREESLRNEQLTAIGTLAANAAHELGTPLSTLLILANELETKYSCDADLQLLTSQILRCRNVVQSLGQDASDVLNKNKIKQPLTDFYELLVDQLNLIRPNLRVHQNIDEKLVDCTITADKTLQQSLLSILNNAADASIFANEDNIEFSLLCVNENLVIQIRDFGKGIPEEMASKIGKTQISDKLYGLGLGLFLANATIERYDGTVTIENHPVQGAVTRVSINKKILGI